MKKILVTTMLFVFLFLPNIASALEATCTYQYKATIVDVKYVTGNDLELKVSYTTNRNYEIKNPNTDIIITLADVLDETGVFSCPVLSGTKTLKTTGKNQYYLKLNADVNGTLMGEITKCNNRRETDNACIDSKSTNNDIKKCVYKKGTNEEFNLYWNGKNVEIELKGNSYTKCSQITKLVQNNYNENDFLNGNCPDVNAIFAARDCRFIIEKDVIKEEANKGEIPEKEEQQMGAINYGNLCKNTEDGIGKVSVMVGYLIQVIKWIIPLLIIIFGMIDFGQAVISNDEKAINKAASTLLRRFIAGIAIFFMPTLILTFLNLIHITGDIENSDRFGACTTCILDVSKCK